VLPVDDVADILRLRSRSIDGPRDGDKSACMYTDDGGVMGTMLGGS
jgi:hypothetical protein